MEISQIKEYGVIMKKLIVVAIILIVLLLPFISYANTLISSTYFGGSSDEGWEYVPAISVVIHPNGDVYVAGRTASTDFPVTVGAHREIHYGGIDLFVACLTPDLSAIKAATFIGGHGEETFPNLAISPDGNMVTEQL